jgi:DNA-binding beta-propeller fold protein YncE
MMLSLTLGPSSEVASQATKEQGYSVSWIAQFPAAEGSTKKPFGERILQLLFGEKEWTLVKPFGVVAYGPEQFWVLDQGAGTLLMVSEGKGKLVRSLQQTGLGFPSLVGCCLGSDGSLFFSDSRLNLLFRTSAEGTLPFGSNTSLQQPTGLAYHPLTGQLWVVETAAHRLTIFDQDGKLVRRIGERGSAPGSFNYPTFLWIDPQGRVYVVDSMNFRVQVFDGNGKFLSCFGENGDGTGQLARPKGVATDSHGHIYLTDALSHMVQIFDQHGRFLFSFGGQGQGQGEFWMPAGIFIDGSDHIYVADSYNARIQVFKLEER